MRPCAPSPSPAGLRALKSLSYFLQEWVQRICEATVEAPIKAEDVDRETTTAVAALDESFFRVRFDRPTPQEQRYLRAMSELGPDPNRSGPISGGA